ncbi:MAG TPA: hypothetical protein VFD58_29330 [Blastocatellia bacterium]|nr:hypothetical protein [Blastocatellia bacterium]
MLRGTVFDDALIDCYQAVSHIIDQYGTISPDEDNCSCRSGDILLIRTREATVVKYQSREVMRVPTRERGTIIWRPCRSWLAVVDSLYEGLEPDIRCPAGRGKVKGE